MADPNAWWDFIESVKGDMTTKKLAERIGVSVPTLSRWRRGARPDVNLVISVARNIDANIVAALVAAEHLSPAEAEAYAHGQLSLPDVPLAHLLDEVSSRLSGLETQLEELQGDSTEGRASSSERGQQILNRLIR